MTKEQIVSLLATMWPKNKAKGILAQEMFLADLASGRFGADAHTKFFGGHWLFSPKGSGLRYSFAVHPTFVLPTQSAGSVFGTQYRPAYAIAEFLSMAGVASVYAMAQGASLCDSNTRTSVTWKSLCYRGGAFVEHDLEEFFSRWGGGKGRATAPRMPMTDEVRDAFARMDMPILIRLALHELFFTGFVKTVLRKSVDDPYDVDGFIVSHSQRHIFPIEIKEKFVGGSGASAFFGIDAGRIVMLLRLCLPTESNALYIIRETDASGRFCGWKYITLSALLMAAKWNLQAGGRGMGGQDTQTVIIPYVAFDDLDASAFDESRLQRMGRMTEESKQYARDALVKAQTLF